MRLGLLIALTISASVLLAGWDFAQRMASSDSRDRGGEDGVVFTGQFDRVHVGLDLLRDRRLDRLFISGVNRGAGMTAETFAQQFSLDAALLSAVETNRLALGVRANTTLENAAETACWRTAHKLQSPVLLITTDLHMPRASLALERALPGVAVFRHPVPSGASTRTLAYLGEEFAKFVGTYVATLLPDVTAARCAPPPLSQ